MSLYSLLSVILMAKMKKNSKLNRSIEEAVMQIAKLESKYNSRIIYAAARRYNDRIYLAKHKKKKCQKKQR